MNRALLDRESLDYVSWTSTSPLMHLSRISHNLSVAIAKKPATDFLPTEFSIWKLSQNLLFIWESNENIALL